MHATGTPGTPGTAAAAPTVVVETVTRRRFVKLLLSVSVVSTLAMVVTPIIGFLMPAKTAFVQGAGRVLAGTSESITPGTGKVVALGSKPVIVCNSPGGFKAYSAVCTHLGCIVGYDTTQGPDIVSPCHAGHFSVMNGSVVSGPPPAPLKPYSVVVEKDQVYVQDA